MKSLAFFVLGLCLLFAAACRAEPVCPPGSVTYRTGAAQFPALADVARAALAAPVTVEIGGKPTLVDRVISGPVCNDVWRQTVYVACNVELPAWKDPGAAVTPAPTFFKDCNLTIQPGTVVYVAAHNDAAYYNGCSCHTGEEP